MTEDQDPTKQIEDTHALRSFGAMAYHVFMGAIDEGATLKEAFEVTAAYFRGMFGSANDSKDEDKND